MHSRHPGDHQRWRNSTAASVICLDAVGASVIAKQQPVAFQGLEVSALLWHLFRLLYTLNTRSLCFQLFFPSSDFHDPLQRMENFHIFGLTTSILHPFGLLPEQMAAAACGSPLVSVKVMLSGISSSVRTTTKCLFSRVRSV